MNDTEKFDSVVFIAQTEEELQQYRAGNANVVACTVNGKSALYKCHCAPKFVVIVLHDDIDCPTEQDEGLDNFWGSVMDILENTLGYKEGQRVGIFAHWRGFTFGTDDWRTCLKRLKNDVRFSLMLVGSTIPNEPVPNKSELNYNLGWGSETRKPIRIPDGVEFQEWYSAISDCAKREVEK